MIKFYCAKIRLFIQTIKCLRFNINSVFWQENIECHFQICLTHQTRRGSHLHETTGERKGHSFYIKSRCFCLPALDMGVCPLGNSLRIPVGCREKSRAISSVILSVYFMSLLPPHMADDGTSRR